MIPAEAVEAAKRAALERYASKPDTAYLRTILEAAAQGVDMTDTTQQCTGSAECQARTHIHGCYSDFGACEEMAAHRLDGGR